MNYGLREFRTDRVFGEQHVVAPTADVVKLIPKAKFEQYLHRVKALDGVGIFGDLLPTYDEYISVLLANFVHQSVLVITNVYDLNTGQMVGHTILHDLWNTRDPLKQAKFDLFGASYFEVSVPPALPEFLDDVFEQLPPCMIVNYFPIYPREYGYQDDKSYGLYIPESMESYVASLSKKNRENYRAVMRLNEGVRVEQVSLRDVMKSADFHKNYTANLERWTYTSDDNVTNIIHINNMLHNLEDRNALVLNIYDADNRLICTNIGEVRGAVYVDKLAVPGVSYEEYKKRRIGFLAIYEAIRFIAEELPLDVKYYHLDTEGTYKEKFIPVGFELPIVPLDYAVVDSDFCAGNYCAEYGFEPPVYIRGKGWELKKLDSKWNDQIDVSEIKLAEFLKLTSELFGEDDLNTFDLETINQLSHILMTAREGGSVRILVARWRYRNPIGYIVFNQFNPNAYIDLVYVTEQMRGHGVGRQMMQKAFALLSNEFDGVALHTSVTNDPAKRPYRALGFEQSLPVVGYYDDKTDSFGNDLDSTDAFYYYKRLKHED